MYGTALKCVKTKRRPVEMSSDISDAVLDGDAYEQAAALTRRVFPLSLTGKIRACSAVLAAAVLLFPAITTRRELIAQLEPAADAPPALVSVVALGSAVTFLFGLVFVRQRHVVDTRTLDLETATRLVRTEDVLMTFAVSTGLLFILVPVALLLAGALSSDLVVYLYEQDIRLYRPAGGSYATTARVSLAGAVLASVLLLVEAATR